MSKGYYGLSFPFRVGVKGGLAMSGTNHLESPHITESIEQILNTRVRERVIESVGCNLSTFIFEPTDEASLNLIKFEIAEALATYEPRITVSEKDIELSADSYGKVIATIPYVINDYTNANHVTKIDLGGTTDES